MNTDAGTGLGGTTLSPLLPPGHLLRAAALTPAVRGYPGGLADMTGEDEGLGAGEFAAGGDAGQGGAGLTGGGVSGGGVSGGGARGGDTGGASAGAGGAAGSVWQQSLAVWRDARIDWLQEERSQAGRAERVTVESDQHNTEPIPVVTGLEPPETLGSSGGRGTAERGSGAALDEDLIVLSGAAEAATAPETAGAGSPATAGTPPAGPGTPEPGTPETGTPETGAAGTEAAGEVADAAAKPTANKPGATAKPGAAAKPGGLAKPGGTTKPSGRRHPSGPPNKPGNTASRPAAPKKPTANKPGGAGTGGAPVTSGAAAAGRGLTGSRTKIVAIGAGAALVAGTIIGVAVASSGSPARPAFGLVTPYPAAVLADGTFAPPAAGPGLPPALTTLVSSGRTVIAAGSQGGPPLSLPLFLVSQDGGHTWARASLGQGSTAQTGGAGPAGSAGPGGAPGQARVPELVARGQNSWLALGQQAAWTSADGTAWQPVAGPPMAAGDQVLGLTRTRTGFLAVGQNVPGPVGSGVPSPVLWTSATGQAWQRTSGAALTLRGSGGLDAGGGSMVSLRWAAYRDGVILVGGEISRPVVQHHGKRKTIVPTESPGLWRSSNGGATWHTVTIPVSHGAISGLAGLAASGPGFVAIRPGRAISGHKDAVAFLSANGAVWHYAGRLSAGKLAPLQVTTVAASDRGFVAAGTTGASRVAFVSLRGYGWHKTADQGRATSTSVAGITVIPGGVVLAAGTRHQPGSASPAGQPYLLLAGAGAGATRTLVGQAVLAASGTADVTVNSIAAAAGQQVAAGSADGAPALWRQAHGRWAPVPLRPPASWTPGSLTSVVDGKAGWLAIGHTGSLGPVIPAPPDAPAITAKTAASAPVIFVSQYGTPWHPGTGSQAPAGPGAAFAQAAAGRAGYVIVGSTAGTGGRPEPAAWHSASLGTWQRAEVPVAGADAAGGPQTQQMLGVTATASGFAAVGAAADLPAVWTSPTGSSWRFTALPLPTGAASAVLTSVAAVGRRVVALGTAVHATGPGHPVPAPMPFTATSGDGGRSWRETVPHGRAAPAAVTALTAAAKGFVAAGLTGPPGHQAMVVWWSADGLSWQGGQTVPGPAGAQGTARLTALGAGAGVLTGAGYAVTGSGVHPFRWQARFR